MVVAGWVLARRQRAAHMTEEPLDPVIHAQARLRVVAALSTLPEGDRIAFPACRRSSG